MKVFVVYLLVFSLCFSSTVSIAAQPTPTSAPTVTPGVTPTVGAIETPTPEATVAVDEELEKLLIAQKCLDEGICTDQYLKEERSYSTIMLYLSAIAGLIYLPLCISKPSSIAYHSIALTWLIWESINNLFIQKEYDTSSLATMSMKLGNDSQLTSVIETIRSVNIAKQEMDGKIQRANLLKYGWMVAAGLAGLETFSLDLGACIAENSNYNQQLFFAQLNPKNTIHSIDWSDPHLATFLYQEQLGVYQGKLQSPTIAEFNQHKLIQSAMPLPKFNLSVKQKSRLSNMINSVLMASAYAEATPEELSKLGLVRDGEGKYDALIAQLILSGMSTVFLGTMAWKLSGITRGEVIVAKIFIAIIAIDIFKQARDQFQKREDALRSLLKEKVAQLAKDPSLDVDTGGPGGGSAPTADEYDVPEVDLDIPGGCASKSDKGASMDLSCDCLATNSCADVSLPVVTNLDGFDSAGLNGDLSTLNSVINEGMKGKSSSATLGGVDLAGKSAAAAKRLKALDELLKKKAIASGKKPSSMISEGYKQKNAMVKSFAEQWPTMDSELKESLLELVSPERVPSSENQASKGKGEKELMPSGSAGGGKNSPFKLQFGKDLNSVRGSGVEISSTVAQPVVETNPDLIKAASERVYDGSADDIWNSSEGDIWQHLSWRYKKSGLPKLDLE